MSNFPFQQPGLEAGYAADMAAQAQWSGPAGSNDNGAAGAAKLQAYRDGHAGLYSNAETQHALRTPSVMNAIGEALAEQANEAAEEAAVAAKVAAANAAIAAGA